MSRTLLVGLLLGCFLISLDQTMVSNATPSLVSQLEATTLYAWIISTYLVGMTLALPIVGRMVEVLPGRRVYLISVLVFLAGTALCGLAPEIYSLILARLIQGLGAGGIFAANSALCGMLFPPRDQGLVLAYFGAVSGLAMSAGALLGGYITDHASWRGVFLVILPLGAVALALMARMPPLAPSRPGHLDGRGSLAMLSWCLPLLALCSLASSRDLRLVIPGSLALVLAAVAGARWFLRVERGAPEPLFDLQLLQNKAFVRASLAAWCLGAFYTGAMTYLPLFMQEAQDVSAITAGYALSAEVLCSILSSYLVGSVVKRTGVYKPFLLAGTLGAALLLLWAGFRLQVSTPVWQLLVLMALLGVAVGLLMPLYPVVVQNAAHPERVGTAVSWVQFSLTLGSAMGNALLGVVLALGLHADFQAQVPEEIVHRLLGGHVQGYVEEQQLLSILRQRLEELHTFQQQLHSGQPPTEIPPGVKAFLKDRPLDQVRHEEIDNITATLKSAIEDGIDVTTASAIRRVYLAGALLALLGLFLSFWIPDVPLKSNAPEEIKD